jgi:hypothetical protein
MNEKIERSNDILSKQLAWISAADSKVAPIFAINAAMLGVLAALIPPIANWTIFRTIITILSVIPLIASMIFLTITTFPRLSGPKGSYIYFGGIVTKSEDSYVNDMTNINEDVFLKDILTQTYRNAEIAKSKFNHIKKAMALTFISLPIWLLAVWLLYGIRITI